MNNQMADAVQLYQQLADQKMKVAKLESNLIHKGARVSNLALHKQILLFTLFI